MFSRKRRSVIDLARPAPARALIKLGLLEEAPERRRYARDVDVVGDDETSVLAMA